MTCVQDKALFQEFVNFCDNQPKDKEIDHSSWESCAVGEFALSKFGVVSIEEDYLLDDGRTLHMEPEIHSILSCLFGERFCEEAKDNPLLDSIANCGGFNSHHTYGEFTQFLKEYL